MLPQPQGYDHTSVVKQMSGEIYWFSQQFAAKGIKQEYRVLVTALTKRMSEDLTEYAHEQGLNVSYMQSDVICWNVSRLSAIRGLVPSSVVRHLSIARGSRHS